MQNKRNKREHSKYGNKINKRKEMMNRKIKYIKISQLNKGNSYIRKHLDLLKNNDSELRGLLQC